MGRVEDFKAWRQGAQTNPAFAEAVDRMATHMESNQVDLKKTPLTMGASLSFDPEKEMVTGELAAKANALLKGSYRKGFTLPI